MHRWIWRVRVEDGNVMLQLWERSGWSRPRLITIYHYVRWEEVFEFTPLD